MGYLIVDREGGMDGVRHHMRRSMMGGYHHDPYPMMRHEGGEGYEHGYRMGYRHGWEDSEDEHEQHEQAMYRRSRDSRGRYV